MAITLPLPEYATRRRIARACCRLAGVLLSVVATAASPAPPRLAVAPYVPDSGLIAVVLKGGLAFKLPPE